MRWVRLLGVWISDGLLDSAASMYGASVVGASPAEPEHASISHAPVPAEALREGRRHKRCSVAQECEAFLAGHYYEFIGRYQTVPSWVCINAVAHARRADLECLAGQSDHSNDRLSGGLSYLAGEVLTVCDHHGVALSHAQREVLVPFEFELSAAPDRPTDIAVLVGTVRSRLEVAARATGTGA
jgi:hypothetical protein